MRKQSIQYDFTDILGNITIGRFYPTASIFLIDDINSLRILVNKSIKDPLGYWGVSDLEKLYLIIIIDGITQNIVEMKL